MNALLSGLPPRSGKNARYSIGRRRGNGESLPAAGFLLVASISFLLSGCGATFNSIYRSDEIGEKNLIISQDAKQRIILHVQRPASATDAAVWTNCVEPPPDVFSVLAASVAGNFTSPNGLAAAISGASSETGASIGLRTQSIQLLRDQGYRICESYANGALNRLDYAQLLRRNQVMLTAVLAIEQLTGAVVGPSAAIGASSSVEIDKDALKKALDDKKALEDKIKTQTDVVAGKTQAVTDQEKIVGDKKTKVTSATATRDKIKADFAAGTATQSQLDTAEKDLKAAQDDFTTAQTSLDSKKKDRETEQQKLDALNKDLGAATLAVTLLTNPNLKTGSASILQGPTVVTKDIPAVANAVRDIVELAFAKQHILDLCQMYWSGSIASPQEAIGEVCDKVLTSWLTNVAGSGESLGATKGGAAPSLGTVVPYEEIIPALPNLAPYILRRPIQPQP
jgi:hypothetical protein